MLRSLACGLRCGGAGQVEEGEVVDLIEQREEARKSRDYATADTLRDVLQHDYGVAVDDDTREWWVGQRKVSAFVHPPCALSDLC